jgi:hypothetical protein
MSRARVVIEQGIVRSSPWASGRLAKSPNIGVGHFLFRCDLEQLHQS